MNDKKKICIIVADYKAPWAEAIKNNTRDLINQLSEKYDFFCIGPSDATGMKNIRGIKSYYVKSPFFITKFKRVFYPIGLISLIVKARKIILKENPDIILSNLESPSVGFIGAIFKRYLKKRARFIQIVNAESYKFNKSPLKYWLIDELPHLLFNNKIFYKNGLKMADQNISITKNMLRKIKSLGVSNVIYIPYGVDLERFKKTHPKKNKKFTIGYLGHLIYLKGGGLLLDAFKDISKESDSELILATTWGSEESALIDAKKIRNFGIIPDQSKFYNKCDLFVLPLRAPFATLNMPQVILEAQACETPVLASDLRNIKEIIKDGKTGYLFKANDKKDLVEKIKQIYKDRKNLNKVVKKAKEVIEKNYDWSKVAKLFDNELMKNDK